MPYPHDANICMRLARRTDRCSASGSSAFDTIPCMTWRWPSHLSRRRGLTSHGAADLTGIGGAAAPSTGASMTAAPQLTSDATHLQSAQPNAASAAGGG